MYRYVSSGAQHSDSVFKGYTPFIVIKYWLYSLSCSLLFWVLILFFFYSSDKCTTIPPKF